MQPSLATGLWWCSACLRLVEFHARVEDAMRRAKLGLAATSSVEPKIAEFTPKSTMAPTVEAPVVVEPVAPLPAYRVAPRPEGLRANVDLYNTSTAVAARSLAHLVRLESPILTSFAARRMADWFGGMRMTQKFMERFDEVVRAALRERTIAVEQGVLFPPPTPTSGNILDSTTYMGEVAVPGSFQTRFTQNPQ